MGQISHGIYMYCEVELVAVEGGIVEPPLLGLHKSQKMGSLEGENGGDLQKL